MQLSRVLFRLALALLPVAVLSTTWLYLYPVFHDCAFPTPPSSHVYPVAPFRLLALGDPQLEGDSSLPDPNALVFPSLENLIPYLRRANSFSERRGLVQEAIRDVRKDALRWLEGQRKAIDLWGNDWYLAHIVRSLRWWTEPTHVSVLGDLLGSQWVTDGEFRKRAGRYWNIVMRGLENVPRHIFGVLEDDAVEKGKITESPSDTTEEVEKTLDRVLENSEGDVEASENQKEIPNENDIEEEEDESNSSKTPRIRMWGGTTEVLGADASWADRVINIAGNHDVGYAGDIDESRIERFERAFGSVNWDIWFELPRPAAPNKTNDLSKASQKTAEDPPALRLVILNSMNLDTPAWAPDLQVETYEFVNHIIMSSRPVTDKTHATILLTHIPLEKEAGLCVDSPFFDFFEGGQGVKEQNMLSDHASKIVLEGIFGMNSNKDVAGGGHGRRGIVLNGHDHAGCDVVHYIRQPGVGDTCQADHVQSHEAYWASSTKAEEITHATGSATGSSETRATSEAQAFGQAFEEQQCIIEPETTNTASQEAATPEADAPPKWQARRFPALPYDVNKKRECTSIQQSPHIRELTLRSMMGEYSGYAGFLSAWFDESLGEKGEWVFEFATCGIGIQHWWWGVHILLLIMCVSFIAGCAMRVYESAIRHNSSSQNALRAERKAPVKPAQASPRGINGLARESQNNEKDRSTSRF